MTGYRRNSVILDFHVMPTRPKAEQVKEFLLKKMQIDMSKTKNIQFCISKSQVIIEVDSAALAEDLIAEHNGKHTMEHENENYIIPVRSIDNAIEVKVHDLPPHLPNRLIAKQLSQYGEVLAIKDDTWKEFFPGMPNGTRTVRIVLKKPIPSYVIVENDTAYIKYPNQIRTCRHCVRALHVGKSCGEARKELDGETSKRLTAAEVVKGLGLPGKEPNLPKEPIITPLSPSRNEISSSDESDDEYTDSDTQNKQGSESTIVPDPPRGPKLRSSSLGRPSGSGNDDLELGVKRPASPKQGDPDKKARGTRGKHK